MESRTLRVLLTGNAYVFLAVCAAFLVQRVGGGPYPDGVDSWLAHNEWLLWTSMAIAAGSAVTVPLLSVDADRAPRPDGDG
ncbi:hypothetical protein [Streptomyces sp. Z26]|uniref:hypothetical protein n=1 Tax=Streptomyces TaxID=1883 RepID=UPI000EF15124|nr:hypothetical protein [Streptomyces sp. Z26]RLL66763.1 hypothetical protein D7M15_07640 [Streptomyces sp. Z26]